MVLTHSDEVGQSFHHRELIENPPQQVKAFLKISQMEHDNHRNTNKDVICICPVGVAGAGQLILTPAAPPVMDDPDLYVSL